ncbi:MAG: hypothetical protein PHX79_08335 [Sphaerochaetaceae bacterium]|nr:hypothetical protein [Sphaerochaetaceae bacterium]
MAEELRELRISRKLPAKEMVSVVRAIYPKYDKTMQSKAERGDEYGIQIRPDAMNALYARFDPERIIKVKTKKGDGHKYTCRISCRLPDEHYLLLQKHTKADGYRTMQDWLTDQVKKYLIQKGELNMEKTIVGVVFKNSKTGDFSGKTYNYFCELNVKTGDIVNVPTPRGDSVAFVAEVDVPLNSIDDDILPRLKTITTFAEETEVANV